MSVRVSREVLLEMLSERQRGALRALRAQVELELGRSSREEGREQVDYARDRVKDTLT